MFDGHNFTQGASEGSERKDVGLWQDIKLKERRIVLQIPRQWRYWTRINEAKERIIHNRPRDRVKDQHKLAVDLDGKRKSRGDSKT